MISDDERREVARRLRELASENRGTLGSMRKMQEILTKAKMITGTMHLPSVAHVLERYADLIDPQERTCHDVSDVDPMRTCHMLDTDHEYEDSVRCDVCQATFNRPWEPFKFCPNCGARVVSE